MADGDFLTTAEEHRVAELIGRIERKTTGEVHVHLATKVSRHGVMADARKTFVKLKIDHTRHRNGVLIYIAVNDRQLAVLGDDAIHSKLGEDAWKSLVDTMRGCFSEGDHYLGLHHALEKVGIELAKHFPSNGQPHLAELSAEVSKD